MAWISCNIKRERWRICVRSALSVAPMKSLTNTSMISSGFSGIVGCRYVGIMTDSNLCQRNVVFYFTISYIISLAVSDPAHKNGGDFHHHICNSVGSTIYFSPRDTGWPSEVGGHTRNSKLVDKRPLGTKNRQKCRYCKIERGIPDCSYLPWLRQSVLVLSLTGSLTLVDFFLLWHSSPTRDTFHLCEGVKRDKNNAILEALVGDAVCRGDFDCGRNSVLDCFIP